MPVGRGSICFSCARFRSWFAPGAPTGPNGPTSFCAAFPQGIPEAIIYGGHDHRTPLGGEATENGQPILFELDPARQKQLDAYEELTSDAPRP